ncbi:MAG: tetratricopeptide repeat protein [Candidatus Omnitrophota bacterium]
MKKIFYTGLILILLASPSFAAAKAKKAVKEGNILYNKGKFDEALEEYEDAFSVSPDSDIVNFNLGAALYKTRDYQLAAGKFERVLVTPDKNLEEKANYNIANAKYKLGIAKEDEDLSLATDLVKQAGHHYERALELDPEDEDAKYNYDFVKEELKRLEEKQKQQQKEQSKSEQNKDKAEEQKKEEQKEQQVAGQESQEAEQKQSEQKQAEEKESQEQKTQEQRQEEEQQKAQAEEKKKAEEEKEGSQKSAAEQAKEKAAGAVEGKAENKEMSKDQALMLLDSYRQEDEPRELYKEKVPVRDFGPVPRDW